MNTTPPPTSPQAPFGPAASGRSSRTDGLAYHRLSHADPETRWYSPLLEGLLGVVVFIGLSLMLSLLMAAAAMGSGLSLREITENRSLVM